MNVLATRQDRAYLAVGLLLVVVIGGLSLLTSINDPEAEINLIGAVAYLSAVASSAITLLAVNVATYKRR